MGKYEQMGPEQVFPNQETSMQRLADGAEVPTVVVATTKYTLKEILNQYGVLAAHDLLGLSQGRQPEPNPWHGDLSQIYLQLCTEQADGSLRMHDLAADVVRNSLHIDPQDPMRFALTDPRQEFHGFDQNTPEA